MHKRWIKPGEFSLLTGVGAIGFLSIGAQAVFAADPAAESQILDLFAMVMGLLGGLAIFLFGMEQMADALKALA